MRRRSALLAAGVSLAALIQAAPALAAPGAGLPVPLRGGSPACARYALHATFSGGSCYRQRGAPSLPGTPGFVGGGGSVSGTGNNGLRYAAKADGSLTSFGNGVLRVTDAGPTIEAAGQNSVLQSVALSNAAWTNLGSMVVTDNTSALNSPDGTQDATKLAFAISNGRMTGSQATLGDGVTAWTCQVDVHAGNVTTAVLDISDASQTYSNEVKVTGLGTSPAVSNNFGGTVGMVAGANGWVRIWISATPANGKSINPVLAPDNVFGIGVTAGDFAYFYNPQCQPGTKPASVIRTTSAVVTRSADTAVLANPKPPNQIFVNFNGNTQQAVFQGGLASIDLASPTAPWAGLPINSVDVLNASVPVPGPAAAAGFNMLTFATDRNFTAKVVSTSGPANSAGNCVNGYQWYLSNGWFGGTGVSAADFTPNADGAGAGDFTGLQSSGDGPWTSMGYSTASPFYCGVAFKGGGYFEIAFTANQNQILADQGKGWPSFWLTSMNHRLMGSGRNTSADWPKVVDGTNPTASTSGTALTLAGTTTGAIAIGDTITGGTIVADTNYIVSGTAPNFVLNAAPATQTNIAITASKPAAAFQHFSEPDILEVIPVVDAQTTGSGSGTTVTVASGTGIANGDYMTCLTCVADTVVTAGGGTTTLTINKSQTIAASTTLDFSTPLHALHATMASHDWYGILSTNVAGGQYQAGCSSGYCDGAIGAGASSFPQLAGAGTFADQYHVVGYLQIPATAVANSGTIQKYLDGVLIETDHYSQCPANYQPPSQSQPWLFCIFDQEPLALNFGGSQNVKMRVLYIHVFQKDALQNFHNP